MKITFTKRNEKGVHCRFCNARIDTHLGINLYETSPIKGIVCEWCKEHLESYLKGEEDKEAKIC